MRCPTLHELPPPPPAKTGWPWTEDCAQLPGRRSDGRDWPRISIITVCLNRAEQIEETIRSVLLQGYPDLEYIIIDGGSTDGTVEIIKKYQKWLGCFVSEPDRGGTHAANKAFDRMTGSLFGWLGSDDVMLAEALGVVCRAHLSQPEMIIAAQAINYEPDTGKELLVQQRNLCVRSFVEFWKRGIKSWHAVGIFTPVQLQRRVGRLDEQLRYTSDHEFYTRLLALASVHYIEHPVVRFRVHKDSLTSGETRAFMLMELANAGQRHWGLLDQVDRRGYEQYLRCEVAPDLFYWGMHRLRGGEAGGVKLMMAGLRIHPIAALWPTLRNLPRKLFAAKSAGEPK